MAKLAQCTCNVLFEKRRSTAGTEACYETVILVAPVAELADTPTGGEFEYRDRGNKKCIEHLGSTCLILQLPLGAFVKNKKTCYRVLGFLATSFLALTGITANAAEAPPPPGITEGFVCSYNPGKDRDDLLAARDYYVRQAAKANIDLGLSVVMHQFKGSAPFDFLWLSMHQNLAAFGAATDAEAAAPELASVGTRFDAVATCTANLGAIRGVFQDPSVMAEDPSFVALNACSARGTMSPGDIQDLRGHINGALGSLDSFKNVFMFSIQPITTNANSADVYLFTAHDNTTGWANRMSELRASEAGQSLLRHFEKTMECNTSLWNSERVIGERQPAAS